MKVIVTGGGGFLGNQLVRALSRRADLSFGEAGRTPISEILAVDLVLPEPARLGSPERVTFLEADVSEPSVIDRLIPQNEDVAVFHLAAIVSGAGEKDFDLAMRVNFDGTRELLEACRRTGRCPRVVLASSVAVYGGKAYAVGGV